MFGFRSYKPIVSNNSLSKVVKQLSQTSQATPNTKFKDQELSSASESTDVACSYRHVTKSVLCNAAEPQVERSAPPPPHKMPFSVPVNVKVKRNVIGAVLNVQKEQEDLLKMSLPFEQMPGPPIMKLLEWMKRIAPLPMASPTRYLNTILTANLSYNRTTQPFEHMFKKYGPLVHLHAVDIVFLSRPEHIQAVFSLEEQHPVRPAFDCLEQYRMHRKLFAPGPFCSSGREWQDVRMRLEAPLRRSAARHCVQLDAVAQELTLRVRSNRTKQHEMPVSFHRELFRWSLESVGLVCLDKRLGCLSCQPTAEATRLVGAVLRASEALRCCEAGFQTWRFTRNANWDRLVSSCDDVNRIMAPHVRAAQLRICAQDSAQAQDGSLLNSFLHRAGAGPEPALSALLDVLLVGINTTSHAAAFLLYHLSQKPKTQLRLYKEVMSFLPQKDFPLTLASVSRMPFLRACVQESLRLRPPLPVLARVLPRDMSLHGYQVRQDTTVLMMMNVTTQREENFENASEFWPERWLESHRCHHRPCTSLPFGHGNRACPARDVAELQLSLLTARLVRNFVVEYHYGIIEETQRLMAIPCKPLKFCFVDRPD